MNERHTYPPWLPDLQDPLGGNTGLHPGAWALPATLLSWGSMATALAFLLWLERIPEWRPPMPLDLVFVALATAIGAAVTLAGRGRPGPVLPRIWSLALTVLSLAVTLGLVWGDTQLRLALGTPSCALFAAAGGLLPRLGRRRLGPLDLHLRWIGVIGPWIGILLALTLRWLGASAVDSWQARSAHLEVEKQRDLYARLCAEVQELATLPSQGLTAMEIGARVDAWEELYAKLSSGVLEEIATEGFCSAAAQSVVALWEHGLPTPTSDVGDVFEHDPTSDRVGVLHAEVGRDPGPSCGLYGAVYQVARRLTSTDAVTGGLKSRLQDRLKARRDALRQSRLDGWLETCLDDSESGKGPERAVAAALPLDELVAKLAAPAGLDAGRPDRWLDLSLRGAGHTATLDPACGLRDEAHGTDRRRQVLDCGILAPEPTPAGPARLQLTAELSWIYSSKEREDEEAPLPEINPHRRPDAMRLWVAVPGGDFFSHYQGFAESWIAALERAGGTVENRPGEDPRDSSAWSFSVRFDHHVVGFQASRGALPEKRQALLLLIRTEVKR